MVRSLITRHALDKSYDRPLACMIGRTIQTLADDTLFTLQASCNLKHIRVTRLLA
jgi:hypothetical protein